MTKTIEKLCELCHQRPATHHICDGGSGVTKALCEICCREEDSPEEWAYMQQMQDSVRNGRCNYCGEPAVGGCGSLMPMLGEKLDLWCEQCRLDLAEFTNKPENAIPVFPFDDEAAQALMPQQLATFEHRKGEFMKQKIAARRARE